MFVKIKILKNSAIRRYCISYFIYRALLVNLLPFPISYLTLYPLYLIDSKQYDSISVNSALSFFAMMSVILQ